MSRREKLERLLESSPDDAFLRYALALECVSAGEVEEGIRGLEQVIERDPDYVAAYFQLGQLLAQRDQLPSAREILKTGIGVARKVRDAHAESEMSGFLATLE